MDLSDASVLAELSQRLEGVDLTSPVRDDERASKNREEEKRRRSTAAAAVAAAHATSSLTEQLLDMLTTNSNGGQAGSNPTTKTTPSVQTTTLLQLQRNESEPSHREIRNSPRTAFAEQPHPLMSTPQDRARSGTPSSVHRLHVRSGSVSRVIRVRDDEEGDEEPGANNEGTAAVSEAMQHENLFPPGSIPDSSPSRSPMRTPSAQTHHHQRRPSALALSSPLHASNGNSGGVSALSVPDRASTPSRGGGGHGHGHGRHHSFKLQVSPSAATGEESLEGEGASPAKLGLSSMRTKQRDVSLAQQIMQRNAVAAASSSLVASSPVISGVPVPLGANGDLPPSLAHIPAIPRPSSCSRSRRQQSRASSPAPGCSPAGSRAASPAPAGRHPHQHQRSLSVDFAPRGGALGSGVLPAEVLTVRRGALHAEQLWEHYAGSARAGNMHRKGLMQLAEDVFEEFCTRLRASLERTAQRRPNKPYTEQMREEDLARELPFLLPGIPSSSSSSDNSSSAAADPLKRTEHVAYIFHFALTRMKKTSAGGGGSSTPRSASRNGPVGNNDDLSSARSKQQSVSKTEFLYGWGPCHARLFAALEVAEKQTDAEVNNKAGSAAARKRDSGPCNLM
jgi:hypothetical protein